jgi:predicted nucleic acid-binding protein
VRQAADSSIALAALLADHEAHDSSEEALEACEATIAHVAVETYSVLTRLPPPHRVSPREAAQLVEARLPDDHVTLNAHAYGSAPRQLAEAQISGGATYDGLIALTALEHSLELLSRDRRAARTYRVLGVVYRLLP